MDSPSTPPRPSAAPRWRRWALAAIGPVALVAILSQVDRSALFSTLAAGDARLLALAYLTPLPAVLIRVARWRLLLGESGRRWTTRELRVFYARAIALGALTPGRVGELVKAGPVAGRGVGLPRALASVLLDRLWDAGLLVVLASLALPLLGVRLRRFDDGLGLAVALALGLAIAAIAAVAMRGGRRLRRWLPDLPGGAGEVAGDRALACAGLTALSWAITLAASWLYARALGLPIGYPEMASLAALCSLVASLPISIAGAGTRDATLLLALAPLGISRPEVLALSTLMLSNTLFVGAVCALAFALKVPAEREA